MSDIDIDHLRQWIGKEQVTQDTLSSRHARLMAATLELDQTRFTDGAPLPPLWHWLYFLEGLPPSQLGPDSHPARGSFLPPVPLQNRMWAGGQLDFDGELTLGLPAEKRSVVSDVVHKRGRSGDLVFVTVRHEIHQLGRCLVSERHDIVFKEAGGPARRQSAEALGLPSAHYTETIRPDATTLFRYSALTFNGHRIHYDQAYCREAEGYPDLVVHGPLNATLLAGIARRVRGAPLRHFSYRGLSPAIVGQDIQLSAAADAVIPGRLQLWAALPGGDIAMQACAEY
jgi:3-methylfumaryl-CoA hydratase